MRAAEFFIRCLEADRAPPPSGWAGCPSPGCANPTWGVAGIPHTFKDMQVRKVLVFQSLAL